MKLKNILSEMKGVPMMKVISNPFVKAFAVVNEAEDDNYTHIGYGKFKEKGKEDDKSAPIFTKTDSGKYVPASGGEDKPKDTKGGVNIFDKDYDGGNEKPKSEPSQPKINPLLKNASKHDLDDMSKPFTVKVYKDGSDTYTLRQYDFDNVEDAQKYAEKTGGKLSKKAQEKGRFGKTVTYLKDVPSEELPKSEPQVKPRPADKVLTKTVDKFSKKLGLSPEKLGKEEYEKRMLSYVHDALEDANFHSANRQIFADLQGRPELAKRPDYSKAPEFGTPEREEWDMQNSIYNKNFDASVTEFDDSDEAVGALTSQAGWEGEKIIDALLDKLRKDGSGELADKIQISFDKDMAKNESTKLKDLV